MSRPRLIERDRSAILSSLAAGVVPSVGLHHIQVGRQAELEAMLSDIQRVENGGASIRFVVGRYGSGKTFFLNVVKTVALERKFVVAQADITTERRLQGSGGKSRALYAELMRNLSTRGRADGGALANLVERWVGDLAHEVKTTGGDDEDVRKRVFDELAPLRDLVSGFDFAEVIAQYYRGFATHNEALQLSAVRWLRAEYTTKTEARNDLGVRSIIDDHSFYDYLKLFAAFTRIAGYRGLLVLVDELVVLSHRLNNRTARDRNYEAILRILNDCLQGSVAGLGVIFAATEECLQDQRRGLYSYEALATRLAQNRFAKDGLVDLSGPVITLPTLTPEECFVLLDNVRHVHSRGDASAPSMVPDDAIESYLLDCQRRMGAASFQTPRETVRDFVGLLNILEQNPGAAWQDLVAAITTSDPGADPVLATATDDETAEDDDLTAFRV